MIGVSIARRAPKRRAQPREVPLAKRKRAEHSAVEPRVRCANCNLTLQSEDTPDTVALWVLLFFFGKLKPLSRRSWSMWPRCTGPNLTAHNAGVVHLSVQHNHMHLIVEADDRRKMSNGLRALFSRVARDLNAVMTASGARFDDRYHQHVLATPTEVRNALYYVIGNRAAHLARWGKRSDRNEVDPFSSVAEPIVRQPRSWLLREGWTRAGPPADASR
jgi:hypothetical protein